MAKKKRIKIRKTWRINPRTRVKKINKRYNRKKAKRNFKRIVKKEA